MMRLASVACALAIGVLAASTGAQTPVKLLTTQPVIVPPPRPINWPAGSFFIFDSYRKTNRPGWYYPGTVPMHTEGGASSPPMYVGGWYGPRNVLAPQNVRALARYQAKGGVHVLVLDAEMWPRDTRRDAEDEIEKSSNYYKQVFKLWREGAADAGQGVLVGAYNCINREYWLPLNYYGGLASIEAASGPNATDFDRWSASRVASPDATGRWVVDPNRETVIAFRKWQESNERFNYGYDATGKRDEAMGMRDAADALFIDCYLFYNRAKDNPGKETEDTDIAADRIYLQANIREARRVSQGKPVIVYMMTWLHEGSTKHVQMSDRRWNAMLDTVIEEGASGLAIWGVARWDAYSSNKMRLAVERAARQRPTTQPSK